MEMGVDMVWIGFRLIWNVPEPGFRAGCQDVPDGGCPPESARLGAAAGAGGVVRATSRAAWCWRAPR